MRYTRFIALALCLLMVSACAVTGAVSAADARTSSIRQYDILSYKAGNQLAGKLTVNLATGHYVVNANYGKVGGKDNAKLNAGDPGYMHAFAADSHAQPPDISFGSITWNKGGNAHGEGTLTTALNDPDVKVVDWLAQYGDGATIYLTYQIPLP